MTFIGDLLDRRAAEQGSDVAFVDATTGAALTWSELRSQADQWRLAADDLGRDRRIGLVVSDPLTMVGAYLAALSAGVTVAPLNPDGAGPERARQAAALGLTAIVTDSVAASAEAVEASANGPVEIWGWSPGGSGLRRFSVPRSSSAAAPAPAGDAAVILASSGTTGDPKIIPLSEAQLLHTASAVVDHHELSAGDRGYCPLPMFHINALVVGVLSTVVAGASLVVERRFSARSFWPAAERHQVTWLNLVPAIIAILADGSAPSAEVADRVAFARSASAPLPIAVRERFERRTGISVLETYGMTEAASQIAANPRADAERRPGSVGRAVGLEARVVDRDDAVVARGEVGQVQIRGASVVDHYWRPWTAAAPEEGTDVPATRNGWLATGDLGRMDRDGYIYLVGRVDDVINRGGEKVFPRDVEEVLLRDEDVTAAAVVGRPHPRFGHEPVAFVLARPGVDPEALTQRLVALCDQELSRFRRPATITVADALPSGPTGKIRHSQLRRELAAGFAETVSGSQDIKESGMTGKSDTAHLTVTSGLELPMRTTKPRTAGLTMVIDNGVPTEAFIDGIASNAELIDVVKFGWGTAMVTRDLDRKIAAVHDHGIRFSFGGTLFEKFASQGRLGAYLAMCHRYGADLIEVSDGTVEMSSTAKAAYIRRCAEEFPVVSEVGSKDSDRADAFTSSMWIDAIGADLAAGAQMVITEARESGSSGICDAHGDLRFGIIEDILASGIDPSDLLFEAPTKSLQAWFVTRIGANVNLGNVAPNDVIGVETLRLGLRSDTFHNYDAPFALTFEDEVRPSSRPHREVRVA